MGKLLSLAACAFLLLLALLYVRREGGAARAVAGATGADSGGEAEALTAVEVPPALAEAGARGATRVDLDEADSTTPEPEAGGAPRVIVHGRVVDAHTGAALPDDLDFGVVFSTPGSGTSFLGALFGKSGMRLRPGAEFEVSSSAPDELLAEVVFWKSAEALERDEPHRYADEREADGAWRLALELGWLARIELISADGDEVELDSAGLRELVDGEEREWEGGDVLRGRTPVLWYREASFDADPQRRRQLQVHARSVLGVARWTVLVDVAEQNGIQPQAIRVALPPATGAYGRVVDERGEPWSGANVLLLPWGGDERAFDRGEARTDEDGEFVLPELRPGRHWLCVSTLPFVPAVQRELEIASGANELGECVVPRPVATAELEGTLVSSDGKPSREARVLLKSSATGLEHAVRATTAGRSTTFRFAGVPKGRYELDVISWGGQRFPGLPRPLDVPGAPLVLVAEDDLATVMQLEVRDAVTGERVEEGMGLVLRHGHWLHVSPSLRRFGCHADEPLAVHAPGYRPVRFERAPANGVIELTRGWGRVVRAFEFGRGASSFSFALDFGKPLAGVRVRLDGREVATTDESGLALVTLAEAPLALPPAFAYECSGYRVVAATPDGYVFLTDEP